MTIAAVLFDLDNTLYPASSGLLQSIDTRIAEYVQNLLGLDPDESTRLRRHYYDHYGTTLRGLQHNYTVDIEDYLSYVHDLALDSFLASDAELDRLLSQIAAVKVVFTNAPGEYAQRVLTTLGIERHFAHVFDIRFFDFQPKPDPQTYRQALEVLAISGTQAILVEDTIANLPPARALGITTILVGEQVAQSTAADYIVPDVLAAARLVIELEQGGEPRDPERSRSQDGGGSSRNQ